MTGSDSGESRKPRSSSIAPTARLIERYARHHRDYAIYPPRLQFTTAFTTDEYRRQALEGNELPLPASLALSIRIPGTSEVRTDGAAAAAGENLERYLNCLFCELALQGLLFDADRIVDELHIAVGRGSLLRSEHAESLTRQIHRHFAVQTASHREFSVFAGALSNEPETISAWRELGINRLQLGPVGRKSNTPPRFAALSFEAAASLSNAARRAGIRSVGADLCYGLPGQTSRQFEQDVAAMIGLHADRIAIRDYQKRRSGQSHTSQESGLPGPAARFDMALVALDLLEVEGYRHLGNCHFALAADDLFVAQDKARLRYTARGYSGHGRNDSIGFGAAAVSHVHHCHAENVATTKAYVAQLEHRRLPVNRGFGLSRDDRIRAGVIQMIMCQDTLTYKDIERRFDIDFQRYFSAALPRLGGLDSDGLIDLCDGDLTLTAAGDLMRSEVARVFDSYSV